MDSILIDKFKECYEISSKVVSKYNELYSIMLDIIFSGGN